MISEHLENVCRIGQGRACCRYIIADERGIHCAKLAPQWAIQIDARVHQMVARSDNCDGKPLEECL